MAKEFALTALGVCVRMFDFRLPKAPWAARQDRRSGGAWVDFFIWI